MNDSSKTALGVLAFVAIIGTASLIAYKVKDVDLAGLKNTVDKVNAIVNPSGELPKKQFDFITLAVGLLLVLTLIQVVRLGK